MPVETCPGTPERVGDLVGVEVGDAVAQDTSVDLDAEGNELAALGRELVAVRFRNALDDALAGETAKVVGHLSHGVGLGEMALDEGLEVAGAEAVELPAETADGVVEGGDAGVAEAQPGSTMSDWAGGHDEVFEFRRGWSAVVRGAFEVEQAVVDGEADVAQRDEMLDGAADTEFVGVVECCLST